LFTESLGVFFETDDFGVVASDVNGATFDCIFDNEAASKDVYSGQIINASPKILARTEDVNGYVQGVLLEISDTNYYIRANLPDGTGVSEVQLTTEQP
jgi:hypothetical protein